MTSLKKKHIVIDLVCGLIILYFSYNLIGRLSRIDDFMLMLREMPFLRFNVKISTTIMTGIELAIASLLFLPTTRSIGIKIAFAWFIAMSGYVAYLIFFSTIKPCSCILMVPGITWNQYFNLNIILCVLTTICIKLNYRQTQYR